MPIVFLKPTQNSTSKNLKLEYYLNLIVAQTEECLNSNGISYISEKDINNQTLNEYITSNNMADLVNINLKNNLTNECLPSENHGIYVFFKAGNPKSKRLASVISKNLKNIYFNPSNVKMISDNTAQNNLKSSTTIDIGLGYQNNTEDIKWIQNNTEEISQNIIMSLTEYFGLPFVPCFRPRQGITINHASVFEKPCLNSKIIGSAEKNKKISILGQWEDWYIIGKNQKLGYIQSKFTAI